MKHKLSLIIFLFTIIFLLLSFAYYADTIKSYSTKLLNFSFCENPITYKIGEVDPKFNITSDEFANYTRKASDIWNNAYGSNLLAHNPEALLTVNLVFDERQSYVKDINSSKNTVDMKGSELDIKISEYEAKLNELDLQVQDLNNEIEYWNTQGGAPNGVYEKLITKQKQVQEEINKINNESDLLIQQAKLFNNNVDSLNNQINQYNSLLTTKPEEGLYNPLDNTIEIYIYEDDKTFVHTLAHEFGHALGLEHLESELSIMNSTVNNSLNLSKEDKEALETLCMEQSRLDRFKTDFIKSLNIVLENKYNKNKNIY